MRGMGCALSIQQNECRKSLGCALYIGARYLPENTVIADELVKLNPEFISFAASQEIPHI
jgi:hypothetical protein